MPPTLTSRMRAEFEHDEALRHDVRDEDIHLSRLTGIAPRDVDTLCDFSRDEGLAIVVRCPKRPARYFHGRVAAKPASARGISSDPETGLATLPSGRVVVSDYDLMSVWRHVGGNDYEKIPFSAIDPSRSKALSPEATELTRKLNGRLLSRIQHGAQDDYRSKQHPNLVLRSDSAKGKVISRFAVFMLGEARYVCDATELKAFYLAHFGDASWPYDDQGRHESDEHHQRS